MAVTRPSSPTTSFHIHHLWCRTGSEWLVARLSSRKTTGGTIGSAMTPASHIMLPDVANAKTKTPITHTSSAKAVRAAAVARCIANLAARNRCRRLDISHQKSTPSNSVLGSSSKTCTSKEPRCSKHAAVSSAAANARYSVEIAAALLAGVSFRSTCTSYASMRQLQRGLCSGSRQSICVWKLYSISVRSTAGCEPPFVRSVGTHTLDSSVMSSARSTLMRGVA
eukprot:1221454-Rhodomonas_salina.1